MSGKEVENVTSKSKRAIDDDNMVEIEASNGNDGVIVSGKDDLEGVKKGKKEDAIPPKDGEPKVDLKILL